MSSPVNPDDRADGVQPTRARRWQRTRTGLTLAAIFVFVILAFVLSLSDSAPRRLDEAAGDGRDVASALEDRVGIDVVDRSDIPYSAMEIYHLVGWFSGTVLIGLAAGRRFGVGEIAAAMFGASVLIEILQSTTTSIRAFELEDIGVNATGILVGLTFVLMVFRSRPGPRSGNRVAQLRPR